MIIIKTSSDKLTDLEKIAETLLKKKMAGCINIIPNCISLFNWKNKINKNKEYLMMIKTVKENEDKLYSLIKKLHSYDVPEIITLKVENVDKEYNAWLNEEVITND